MNFDDPEITPAGDLWWRMCPRCAAVDHEHCEGGDVWCECLAELLMEAEEIE